MNKNRDLSPYYAEASDFVYPCLPARQTTTDRSKGRQKRSNILTLITSVGLIFTVNAQAITFINETETPHNIFINLSSPYTDGRDPAPVSRTIDPGETVELKPSCCIDYIKVDGQFASAGGIRIITIKNGPQGIEFVEK